MSILDPYRCQHCANIAHFEVIGVDWADTPFDWKADNTETPTGERVCRLHVDQATRPDMDAVDFRPSMTRFTSGRLLRGAVAKAAADAMTESVVQTDWVSQADACTCLDITDRGHCNHGVERTFYNTGRVDILIRVPVARFQRAEPLTPTETHPYAEPLKVVTRV